ncbi:hypothetical protein FACS189421_11630 [Bacteroidia bacterium]|nr:hypothetical protein FACS189421_11630 [Bacteroidia bacterium]GHT45275.1 hypothetical protein FACS189440_00950 [Bacteroidia bacterium]
MAHNPTYLYAAYLNMARHNAYLTLSYISVAIGGKEGAEDKLLNMEALNILKKPKAEPEKLKKTEELLTKHFRFLLPMTDNDKSAGYHEILTTAFKLLNSLRNEYTHYQHEASDFDEQFMKNMKNCFDGAKRTVKERFNLEDNDLKHLDRFRQKANDGKKGKREYEENPTFHYKFDDENGRLTEKGLAFFICLFLEKKYATLFLTQLSGFKKGDTKGTKATKEVYSIYRIQLPKLRIDSKKPEMALGIDMLNELKKCPAELYDVLSTEDQKRFRIIPDEEPDTMDDTEDGEILLKRHKNRFPYMALRYIDQNELFPNIRFQVALGTYRHHFYNKLGVDNIQRVRILQKQLKGFGRLDEIEEKRKTVWADKIRPFEKIEKDSAEQEPYITDSYAKYIISNNKIGLKWFDRQNDYYLPELNEKGAKNEAPTCWLSIYELPALLFHSILCNHSSDTQNIIRDYVSKGYRKLFKEVASGALQPASKEKIVNQLKTAYNLDFTRIPKELQDYLTGKPVKMDDQLNKLCSERIAQMVSDSQKRLERIDNDLKTIKDRKSNKVGKKRFVEIKSGVLADFLAEDMLAFQSSSDNGKDKLTGMNYQILQAALAYFGQYKDQMTEIFEKCKLINSPIEHPFLKNVMAKNATNIVDFYIVYLKAKEIYLDKCLREKQYKNDYFLHVDRQKWTERNTDFYKVLAKSYAEKLPVELPRGLFNDAIKKLLTKKHGDNPVIREALSKERCNTTFLIQTYFKAICEDTTQEYYTFNRSYKIFNLLNDNYVGNKLQPAYYAVNEFEKRVKNIDAEIEKFDSQQHDKLHRLLHHFKENEKILRLYKVQDILLFLMAKRILITEMGENNIGKYQLKQIMPDSPTDILSAQTSFSITLTKNGCQKIIKQEKLKLKNFGDFQRFVRDRRIETLFPYMKADSIDRQILEAELDAYDDKRVHIFELIHQFEESVLTKNPSILSGKTYINFAGILKASPEIQTEKRQQMQIIRNAFCHNTYPQKIEKNIEDIEKPEGKTDVPFSLCEKKEIPEIAEFLTESLEDLIIINEH